MLRTPVFLLCLCALQLVLSVQAQEGLCYNYYANSCPQVEQVVQAVMEKRMKSDPGLGAALLRMHFHDCFVEGCDGSILINSTSNNVAEKDFHINKLLRGFDAIDEIKDALEKACPGVVSCADILALTARDGVRMLKGPSWEIRTGRKDGRMSMAGRAEMFLAPSTFNLQQLKRAFVVKGLNEDELVTLSGGHTIGISHCSSFSNRLYNFNSASGQDPSLDPQLAKSLKKQCVKGAPDGNVFIPMDQTPLTTDSDYYKELLNGRGLFTSDVALLSSHSTWAAVKQNAHKPSVFFTKFVAAMIKMSEIEVKTGYAGEVRKKCSVINKY